MISPMTLFNIIMQMINAFQEYTAPAVITGGGPVKRHRYWHDDAVPECIYLS